MSMYDNLKQVRAHLNEHGWETSTLDEVRNLPHGDDGQAHAYLIADGSIQEYRMWQVSRAEDDIPQDVIPSEGEHLVVVHDHVGFPGMYGEAEYSQMGYVVEGQRDPLVDALLGVDGVDEDAAREGAEFYHRVYPDGSLEVDTFLDDFRPGGVFEGGI